MAQQPVYSIDEWQSSLTGYYSIGLAGELFSYQGASHNYSILAPSASTVRFELHDGDQHAWDASVGHASERDEIATRSVVATTGTAVEVSYGFTLEQGSPNTASWMILGQLHQNVDYKGPLVSPPFEVALDGEHMELIVRYVGASGKEVPVTIYSDPQPIDRGHQYQMDIKFVADSAGGDGHIVVIRDGVTIADYQGPVGDPAQSGVYWAEGIYRDSAATETVAADYADLKIVKGSAVIFPSASEFIGAPTMKVSAATALGGKLPAGMAIAMKAVAEHFAVTLTGTAKAGTTVTIYEGKNSLGSAAVDAAGNYSLTVDAAGVGTHAYYAIATDATGRSGLTSSATDVYVGTSASIEAQLGTILSDPRLGGVVLTDGNMLTVDSTTQLYAVLRAAGSMTTNGSMLIRLDQAIAGKSGYDHQVSTYDLSGAMVSMQRYQSDRLTMDQTVSGSASVTANYATDGSRQVVYSIAGVIKTVDAYTANGAETSKQTYLMNGAKEFDYYAADGSLSRSSMYLATGGRIDTQYGITGKSYVSQVIVYDSSSKMVSQGRYDAAGHLVFATDVAKGTSTSYSYGATGMLSSYRLVNSDGSYSTTSVASDGRSVNETTYFTAQGVLVGHDMADPGRLSSASVAISVSASLAGDAQTGAPAVPAALAATTPTLTITSASAGHAQGTVAVAITGTGKIGSIVTIYDGATSVGTAVIDSTGKLSVEVEVNGSGEHDFTAVAADAAGGSATSAATKLLIGTASDIAKADGPFAATYVVPTAASSTETGSTAPPGAGSEIGPAAGRQYFASYAQLQAALKTAAVDGLSHSLFTATDAVTNQSYDHVVRTLDGLGTLSDMKRMSAGAQIFDQLTVGALTVTQSTDKVGGSSTMSLVGGGLASSFSYDAAGHLVSTLTNFSDGARQIDMIDAVSGAITSSTIYNTNGTRLEWSYGVNGKGFVSQVFERDTSGKLVFNARWDADNHFTLLNDMSNGTSLTFSYGSTGVATSYRLAKADGSYSITTPGVNGQTASHTTYYNSHGSILGQDASDPGAVVVGELHNLQASVSSHDAIDHNIIGTAHADSLSAAGASILNGGIGNDLLVGSAGNDILIGGGGADVMSGGGGQDVFWFDIGDVRADSTTSPDRIRDFAAGDHIDLAPMAGAVTSHTSLSFIGSGDFDGKAGEVHFASSGGNTYVSVDLNGDRVADFTVMLDGVHHLTENDFLL